MVLALPVRQHVISGTSVNFCFFIYPVSVQGCVSDNKLLKTGSPCSVNYYSRVEALEAFTAASVTNLWGVCMALLSNLEGVLFLLVGFLEAAANSEVFFQTQTQIEQ